MILIADIQRAVADTYSVPVGDLKEPDGVGSRSLAKIRPRHLAMFLARTNCMSKNYGDGTRPISFAQIGRNFGNRDHATIHHAVNSIAKERLENKRLDIVLRNLEREIKLVDNCQSDAFRDCAEVA